MVLGRGRSGLRLGVIFLFACLLWLAPATSRAAAEVIFSDDFESDFGSFLQVAGDDFDWSRDSGGTPSTGTGPSIDHTFIKLRFRGVTGSSFSSDIAVDRSTHLVTAFDQISSPGTWGKRWV